MTRNTPSAVMTTEAPVSLFTHRAAQQRRVQQIQNICWAAGYDIVMVPLAAGVLAPWSVLIPPAVGALLMSISTLVVAANAQLLRRVDLDA
jgi:P-type Cu2+ transporter